MARTFAILLTLVLNAYLPITFAGEDDYLWQHELSALQDIISVGWHSISFSKDYASSIPLTALLSLLGQLLLLCCVLLLRKKNEMIRIGVMLLWLALANIILKSSIEIIILFFLRSVLFNAASIWLLWLTYYKPNLPQESING